AARAEELVVIVVARRGEMPAIVAASGEAIDPEAPVEARRRSVRVARRRLIVIADRDPVRNPFDEARRRRALDLREARVRVDPSGVLGARTLPGRAAVVAVLRAVAELGHEGDVAIDAMV